jgi:hypothetical protein
MPLLITRAVISGSRLKGFEVIKLVLPKLVDGCTADGTPSFSSFRRNIAEQFIYCGSICLKQRQRMRTSVLKWCLLHCRMYTVADMLKLSLYAQTNGTVYDKTDRRADMRRTKKVGLTLSHWHGLTD